MTSGSLFRAMTLGLAGALAVSGAAMAGTYDITVDRVTIDTGDFTRSGVGYNGTATPPTLRFEEGEDVVINVTNNLAVPTSIHWHGLILPFDQELMRAQPFCIFHIHNNGLHVARSSSLDGGIEGQQVGLKSNLVNDTNNVCNLITGFHDSIHGINR